MKNKSLLLLVLAFTTQSFAMTDVAPLLDLYYSGMQNGKVLPSRQALITTVSNEYNALYSKATSPEDKLYVEAIGADIFAGLHMDQQKALLTDADIKNLSAIEKKMAAFQKDNKNLSPEFLVALGATSSRIIHLNSLRDMIGASKRNFKNYEMALKINKNFFPAYMNMGLWYFYAPKIGGGDINKAESNMKKALSLATNDTQKYLANIWLSQIAFKKGDRAEANTLLQKAAAIYPAGGFYKVVESFNKRGQTFKVK